MKQFIQYFGGCIIYLLSATLAMAQPNLTRVEYYIDKDPGYGKATSISFTAGNNLSNIALNINPANLTNGVHVIGIRAKDTNNAWSFDNKWLLAKPYAADTTKAGTAPNIKQVEYYIDKDPGFGKGVPIAIATSTNLANINLAVNISGLTTGNHNLFIRSKDDRNAWSLDNVYAFKVGTAVASPSIVVNSVVRKTLCQKDSVNVSYQALGTYNTGNVFNAELSDATGSFASPLIIGSFTGTGNSIIKCLIPVTLAAGTKYKIRIKSTNPIVTGLAIKDSLKISKLPAPVITPAGTLIIKQGDSVKLATTATYSSYLWSSPATTSTIQVKKFGAYTVKVTDVNGCSATSAPVQVNVTPVITSSKPVTNVCPGTTVTLTSSVANSYNWNTAATTQSIVVSTAGTYYVVVNGGGKGDTSAKVNVTYAGCGTPGTLTTTTITTTSAKLNWGKITCEVRYQLQYRLSGATTWTLAEPAGTGIAYTLTGLSAAKTYQWQVRAVCVNTPLMVSTYSATATFTTSAALLNNSIVLSGKAAPVGNLILKVSLYPNPAKGNATLQFAAVKGAATVMITDMSGKILWQKINLANSKIILPVERFKSGTYLVEIKQANHKQTLRLVKVE